MGTVSRRLLVIAPLVLVTGAAIAEPPPPDSPPQSFGRLFISPMGEPFRGGDAPEKNWFAGADRDHDGRISRTEFTADAMRFFASLDLNHNGQIDPAEIDHYEQVIVPEIGGGRDIGDGGFPASRPRPGGRPGGEHHGGMGGGRRGGGGAGGPGGEGRSPQSGEPEGGSPAYVFRASGAGRFGYLATPEPVSAADADLDRIVTAHEFVAAASRRFEILDQNGDGLIEPRELPALPGPHGGRGRHARPPEGTPPQPD